jgi:hypothetical protein
VELIRRYQAANEDPDLMAAIVAEPDHGSP